MVTESILTGEGDAGFVVVEQQQETRGPRPKAETSARMNKTEREAADEFGVGRCRPQEECMSKKKLAEEEKRKETEPMKLFSSLPIVVTDCANTVLAAVSESTEVGEDAVSALELQASAAAVDKGDEATTDLLSPEFQPVLTTQQESAEDEPTTATPLFGEQGARSTGPEEPVLRRTINKEFAEDLNEEPIEALSKDLVPESFAGCIAEVSSEQPVAESARQPETTILAAIPETTEDEGAEERAEDSTPDSQSADTDALLARLESACTVAVEASAYRLGGLDVASLGHSITITIHVAPKAK